MHPWDDLYAQIDERLCRLNDEAFESACLWCEDGFFSGSFGIPDYEAIRVDADTFKAVLEAMHQDRRLLKDFTSFTRLARQRMMDQFMLFAVSLARTKTALEHVEMSRRTSERGAKPNANEREEMLRQISQLKEKMTRLRQSCDHRLFAERINERCGMPLVDGLQIRALAIVLGEDALLLEHFSAAATARQ